MTPTAPGAAPTVGPAGPGSDRGGADVVVVGAGIIGLTVAWRAAREGRSVTVCAPSPDDGAWRVAAGMLAPVTEAHAAEAPLAQLGLASLRRWPSFADELAADAGCRPADLGLDDRGTLQVAFDDDDRRALDELHRVHQVLGLESEPCTAARCRQLEPLLSPGLRAGLLVAGDWQVDPRLVVGALRRAVDRHGGRLVTGTVRRLLWSGGGGGGHPGEDADPCSRPGAGPATGGSVRGVALDDGTTVPADAVVLAAGAWSTQIGGLPPQAVPPVRPVKGEILRLRADPGRVPLSLTVRGTVRGRTVYVVPRRHGEVVVGATMEEAGFDTDVRAGSVLDLLRAAVDLLPAVGELPLIESSAGLRPATPDNGPVLGPTPVPGLHLATGHFRNGVLLAPVTGDAVVAALDGGRLAGPAAAFGPGRFGRR